MGYLYKKTELNGKTSFELRTKNFYFFTAIIFSSLLPAALYLAIRYFENTINLFRVFLVVLMISIYAILDGRAIVAILFARNKTREGSLFSFKKPVKYTIARAK